MASTALKGTRKTYSFEEREILITLINKYEDVEDKKSDPISMCKRKSAWSQLAEEYNSMVGPQGARSAVQLRRCWENMKACKRNREEKKLRGNTKTFYQLSKDYGRVKTQYWETGNCRQSISDAPASTGNVGLPPNVMFEPKESEPFTLQSVCTAKLLKKEPNTSRDSVESAFTHVALMADSIGNKSTVNVQSNGSMDNCSERSTKDLESSIVDRSDGEEPSDKNHLTFRSDGTQTLTSPSVVQDYSRKTRKSVQRQEELHVLALSEAQIKVDIAAMLKEEARIKLEEAHYRKEEARLRMLFFTYKVDKIKED